MFWKKKVKEENDIELKFKNHLKNYILNDEIKKKFILHDYEKYLVYRKNMENIEKGNEKDDQNMQEIQKEILSFYQQDKLPQNLGKKLTKTHSEEEDKFYSFMNRESKDTETKDYKFHIKMKNSTSSKFYQENITPNSIFINNIS